MPERMKPYFPSVALLLVFCYLGVQALTGDRGLLGGHERRLLLAEREHQLAELIERRADMEVRVRYLKTDHLSRDLLEERARAVLGFADPRDYVIRVADLPGVTADQASVSTRS
ncbi:FtsB family cell division protein [Brevundimonas sp. VNH65]|uniref:FtsB family cell division protein n=1 Tax=Brevundimonas sp. VNH65 TaxID=3400917 RepID=UPI003C0622BA